MDRKKIAKDTAVAGNVVTTITVPAGERWLLTNVTVLLTTDATVANRVCRVSTTDGTDVIFRNEGSNIAASLTAARYFTQMVSTTKDAINALGLQILDAGQELLLSIYAGVAGDAYDYVVEYLKVEI